MSTTKHGLVLVIDQPPGTGAPQHATPTAFEATDAGGANGDTTISASLGLSTTSNDQPVGWLEESTDDTVNRNLRRRIVDYVDATGTVTHDRFPAATASGDGFNLIVPTHPYWSEDTGGSAIQIQDATRAEANDYWNGTAEEGGPYVEVVRADNATKTSLKGPITDFTLAGGVATVALGANSAIGDLFEAWCCPEWLDQSVLDLTTEQLDRDAPAGSFATPGPEVGRRMVTGAKKLPFVGPGRGRAGLPSMWHRTLKNALADQGAASDLTADAAGTTSSVVFDAGTVVKGNMYLTSEGDVFMANGATSPVVPLPSLRTAPVADTTVRGLRTYHPATVLPGHLCLKQYRGKDILEYVWGAVAKWRFEFAMGQFFTASLDIEGSDWLRLLQDSAGAHTRAWRSKRPTVNTVRPTGGRVVLDGTAMRLKSGTIDLGLSYVLQEDVNAPNGVTGYALADVKPSGSFVGVVDTPTANGRVFTEADAGRELTGLLVQIGTKAGFPGVFGFYGYKAQITSCKVSDDGGKQIVEASWQVNDHDTDTSGLPTFAVGIG